MIMTIGLSLLGFSFYLFQSLKGFLDDHDVTGNCDRAATDSFQSLKGFLDDHDTIAASVTTETIGFQSLKGFLDDHDLKAAVKNAR